MEGIKFGSGALYIKELDKETLLADQLSGTAEFEFSAKEDQSIHFDLQSHREASFSCEVYHMDIELLNKYSATPVYDKPFSLEYEMGIMIQARWHKKARTRKKWLKCYGMKPDTVKIVCEARALEFDTIDSSFELDAENFRYIFRPGQKRRGLKIDWRCADV